MSSTTEPRGMIGLFKPDYEEKTWKFEGDELIYTKKEATIWNDFNLNRIKSEKYVVKVNHAESLIDGSVLIEYILFPTYVPITWDYIMYPQAANGSDLSRFTGYIGTIGSNSWFRFAK